LTSGLDDSRRLFADLAACGLDVGDVVSLLEAEGVQKFADSFTELLDGIRAKQGALAAA
jgi:transaldolase